MLAVVILVIVSLLNLLLGIIVFVKNPTSITHRYFLMMTTSIVLWSAVNFISVNPIWMPQLFWIRLVMACAIFLCLSVFLMLQGFPSQHHSQARLTRKLAILTASLVIGLSFTPLVFESLEVTSAGVQPVPGPAIPLFVAEVVALVLGAGWTIIKKFQKSRGRDRLQILFVLVGLGGTLGLIIITNFVLVLVFKNTSLIPIGPAWTLIFSGAFAYAIIRHRLFDIRAAVARSLAYALSLGSLGVIYGATLFTLSATIGGSDGLESGERFVYVCLALLSGVLFPATKRFFDQITNSIFYRGVYEPQVFFNELNQVLVENVEVRSLLETGIPVITNGVGASYGAFVVAPTNYEPQRIIQTKAGQLDENIVSVLKLLIDRSNQKIVFTDYFDEKENMANKEILKLNISVIAKISKYGHDNDHMALLILGPKKNGDSYTASDANLLDIVTKELVIALENALRYEEIQQFNVTLQGRVDEATRKLRATNDKLKKLDETKDEFISMASHQLRTPLTSIKGYLSMVLEGDAGKLNPQQALMLKQSYMSSQRMVNLIADLLNLSRLNTGKFVIQNSPTDLRVVVDQEVSLLGEAAAAKDISLNFSMPKTFTILPLDENKIHQVVMNFIDNALYYTPHGGAVDVSLIETPAAVEFRVKDTGIGVPRAMQRHLFTKFYRAENAKQIRPDGTGLGLFMAKKVIVEQGGSIIFESVEGQGSTFGFRFSKRLLHSQIDTGQKTVPSSESKVGGPIGKR